MDYKKFIDSVVGNIARKIEDEFNESDHPRDKGGKFTSKGGEGRGGGKKEKSSSGKPMNISVSADGDTEGLKEEAAEYGVKARIGSSSHGETSVKLSGAKEDIRRYLEEKFYGSEDDAREFSPEVYEKSEGSEEDGKESGSEGADEGDADVSLEQYKKNVSENFDGDEEYEVEARYDRAKYHSDKFKKLQNGEYDGTPEEKYLKNYYRRLGIKKPEDAFKVWWDI